MQLKTLYCIVIIAISNFLLAQENALGTLYGSIKFDDNEPAIGIYILFTGENFKKETTTDSKGQVVIPNIPFGNYNLHIQSLNAETKDIAIQINQKQQHLNSILKTTESKSLTGIEFKTKTVKQKIEEQGFAVNVIETKDFEKETYKLMSS